MKYFYGILCLALGIVCMFELATIKDVNALYGTIFLMLATLFIRSKWE